MEKEYTFVIKSKITNVTKFIIAVDKFHAINKAKYYFTDHLFSDFTILKKL